MAGYRLALILILLGCLGFSVKDSSFALTPEQEFVRVLTHRDGLGPRFNHRSCAGCHSYPTLGGSEGFCEDCVVLRGMGANQITHRYSIGIELGGSAKYLGSGTESISSENVSRRRPLQLFGLAVVESIRDEEIVQHAESKGFKDRVSWVVDPHSGRLRVGKFGWKGEFSSLDEATSIALSNEHGIQRAESSKERLDNLIKFQRDLLAPKSAPPEGRGFEIFKAIGCAECHLPTYPSIQSYFPYSDFLLHDMGEDGDGVVTDNASASEMRTAPLWGLVGRFPQGVSHPGTLYHDRRHVANLEQGVKAHARSAKNQAFSAVRKFGELSVEERVLLISFLKDLGTI